eukprot:gnl/MRDRNA2_/MRDRNA2_128836_c0_seq1.p1 gnl/MRDRNA2_/MRDRNA2_128836_c0~~gnl/MRDRNA2_/MRDRNA2_128836_c0_seq1.p1  ORF type:complete len:554 (-),score=104.52 gnl/MRDRNA2_/MRDRNA2_128836_c0_seq1:12-1673(-)
MPFGAVDVECSRPRVPLYPYANTEGDDVILHYSRRRPRLASAKRRVGKNFDLKTGCSLPNPKPRSRPHTAAGFAPRSESPCKEDKEQLPGWNGRHHVTGSLQNTKLYTFSRIYFDELPGEVPKSDRRYPKKQSRIATDETEVLQVEGESQKKPLQRSSTLWLEEQKERKRVGRNVLGTMLEQQVQLLYEAASSIPGLQSFADFYMWCVKKFKNLTRCWRLMDQNLNMKITKLEFLTSLNKYEFKGDARAIFNILDRDRSGILSYYHFDPAGAEELAALRQWVKKEFGTLEDAFLYFDEDKDGRVTPAEFERAVKRHGFQTEGVICLFEMLDLDRDHRIKLEELEFLDKWTPLPFLMAESNFEEAEKFKVELLNAYQGNSIKAWCAELDKNKTMRVSWEEFDAACRHEHIPKELRPHVFRALDTDLSGWISLREIDEAAWDLLLKFKKYCEKRYGSVQRAFDKVDLNGNGSWSRKEFQKVECELDITEEEGETLFHGLALDGSKQITYHKLKYLDHWGIEDEQRENDFWTAIAASRKKAREQHQTRASVFGTGV